jgi:hypothetical protein
MNHAKGSERRPKMKKILGSLTIFLIALSGILAEEVPYTNRSFARLSYVIGSTYIQRAQDLVYEEGIVNMPITEGDRLGTTEGRAEIYLGNGSYVRLDNRSKLDFINLPRKDRGLTQIRIWAGSVYVSIRDLFEEMPFEIHTPDISIYILERGLYRFDIRESAESEILVFQGMLEAAGETGSTLIKDAQRITAIQGHFTSRPLRFMAVADDTFDRWNDYREVLLRKRLARSYLPAELEDFEYELATYGEWVYIPPYGHVWVPGGMGSAWRPYYRGRWLWYPICGWTWLPYEPWGWVTCHYGRWHWRLGIGWYWIPTTHWGPGWVHWYASHNHWGWAPLSYYNRPGVIVNNIYYDRYPENEHPHNSGALTVIAKDQLRARDVSKVAVRKESLQKERVRLARGAPEGSAATTEIEISRLESKKAFRSIPSSRSTEKSVESGERGSSTERMIRPSGKPTGIDRNTASKEKTVRTTEKKKSESPSKRDETRSSSKKDTSKKSQASRSSSSSKTAKVTVRSPASQASKSSKSISQSKSTSEVSSKTPSRSSSRSSSSKKTSTKKSSSKSRKKK